MGWRNEVRERKEYRSEGMKKRGKRGGERQATGEVNLPVCPIIPFQGRAVRERWRGRERDLKETERVVRKDMREMSGKVVKKCWRRIVTK